MKKKYCILLIFCFIQPFFVQAQEEREEMKALLREAKNFLESYQNALNRLGSPKTDWVVLPNLVDSISTSYFASPATKVFNDLEPNAKDLLPTYVQDYLENIALNSRKGIVTTLEICKTEISPKVMQSANGVFPYFDLLVKKKVVGFNQEDKEIKHEAKMSLLISFETIIEEKEGKIEKSYKNLLIRKIEPALHNIDDYVSDFTDLQLSYQPSQVHLSSNPYITWKSKLKEGGLNIELWEVGKTKPIYLVENLPLTAYKYKWKVGNDLEIGKNYVLKIKSLTDPLCVNSESNPFTAKPKIKKGRWVALGSAVLVGTLTLIFKNKIFPPNEPLLPDVPRNNPK
jgi:hypothetical protein